MKRILFNFLLIFLFISNLVLQSPSAMSEQSYKITALRDQLVSVDLTETFAVIIASEGCSFEFKVNWSVAVWRQNLESQCNIPFLNLGVMSFNFGD